MRVPEDWEKALKVCRSLSTFYKAVINGFDQDNLGYLASTSSAATAEPYSNPLITEQSASSSFASEKPSKALFQYSPLRDPEDEFRLIKILPADSAEAPLLAEMWHSSLTTFPSANYAALSYSWEEIAHGGTNHVIEIDGKALRISRTVCEALVKIREAAKSEPLTLWADTICINQHDDVERAEQVKIMKEIFKNAAKVIVLHSSHKKDDDSSATLKKSRSLTDVPAGLQAHIALSKNEAPEVSFVCGS